MRKLALFFVILVVSAWTLNSVSESRTSHWTCEMNAFFSGEASQQIDPRPQLTGRGLVSCQNPSGFTFDVPVQARLRVLRDVKDSVAEQLRVTLYSEPFVIARDLNQIYDVYARQSAPVRMMASQTVEMMLTGDKRGLMIPVRLSIPEEALGNWQVDSLELDFDEDAPEIF